MKRARNSWSKVREVIEWARLTASSNLKWLFSKGCGTRSSPPMGVLRTPSVGAWKATLSWRSRAATNSRQKKFFPWGVPIRKAHPSVSEMMGRITSYQARSCTSGASSTTTPAAVSPRALSGKVTSMRLRAKCAAPPHAFCISRQPMSHCPKVGAPHRMGSPRMAASAESIMASVVLRHRRPADSQVNRFRAAMTFICPSCGAGSLYSGLCLGLGLVVPRRFPVGRPPRVVPDGPLEAVGPPRFGVG